MFSCVNIYDNVRVIDCANTWKTIRKIKLFFVSFTINYAFMAIRENTILETSSYLDGYNLSDYLVKEEEKESLEYLMEKTDSIIANLVDENSSRRREMFKMRDFYDGIRDPREYAYLEDNYGIGNPSEIKFTPLIRTRLDILIGLLSTTEFDYKVTISDSKSLFAAEQEKTTALLNEVFKLVVQEAKKQGEKKEGEEVKTTPVDRLLVQAEDQMTRSWRNLFVESAIDFIEDARECPIIDLRRLRELIFEDIVVVGETVYRNKADEVGRKPKPEVYLPENFYYNLHRDQSNINETNEAVYVRYLSKEDALMKYGHLMTKDEKKEVLELPTVKYSSTTHFYAPISGQSRDEFTKNTAIDRYNRFGNDLDVVKVFEVEWKANNEYDIDPKKVKDGRVVLGPDKIQKKRHRQDLYRSIRINDTVYLDMGKDSSAVRYDTDPDRVYLTFNGARYSDRGGKPYSILWKGKDIQDKHDILLFHRDNLIASSGVRGVTLEYSKIPEFYGSNEIERVMKALAMIKQGVNITDGTQEGSEGGSGGHGTFDMTINGESLNAINATIQQLDAEATKITGVTPQMLGAVEAREAVSNVKVGVNNASLTLKKLYDTHDRVMKFLLGDMINTFKITIGDEYQGSYQEGYKVFKIIPKYFSFTNYRLQVINSSQEKVKIEEAKALIQSAMSTGSVPWNIGLKILMMDNPSELLQYASEVAEKQEDTNKKLMEMGQQNEELTKELEKYKKQLEGIDQAKQQLDKEKLTIEKQKAAAKIEFDKEELNRRKSADSDTKSIKERQLDLEEKQIYLSDNEQQRRVRRDI